MQLLPFDRARIFEEHSPHFLRHFLGITEEKASKKYAAFFCATEPRHARILLDRNDHGQRLRPVRACICQFVGQVARIPASQAGKNFFLRAGFCQK